MSLEYESKFQKITAKGNIIMPSHSSPGVFVEETSLHSHSIEGVSTYVVAFVGSTNKGVTAEPILINKFEDYTAEFGDIASEADSMGLAVQAYYLNGGETAYICSLSAEISNVSSPARS